MEEEWTVEDSARLYRIRDWGGGYFGINEKGHVQVDPHQDGRNIDLRKLVDEIHSRGLHLPVLIRFSNILQKRIEDLHQCFETARKQAGYKGRYFCVYPIKVNQQRQVVEEIVRFGRPFDMGLEAGSKPELHAVLALMDNPLGLIICNGYKDDAYIRMALMGQKLDREILIVVEKPAELNRIFRISRLLKVRPQIGLRIKLSTCGAGHWERSGGESSKFGLTVTEILNAVAKARSENLLDSIRLLHFHLGTQITDLKTVRESMREISHFYSQLVGAGCDIQYINVGGGLGVDYDGTRSRAACSVNYSLQDYADSIVSALDEICRKHSLPHPHIVSESGRALTAHHSVMVLDVLEAAHPPLWKGVLKVTAQDSRALQSLYGLLQELERKNALQSWQQARRLKELILKSFKSGEASLQDRARMERIFWAIVHEVYRLLSTGPGDDHPEELNQMKERLSSKYFCNFSVFQSLPDSWAIRQLFPIMPIHRLGERPDRQATLQDISCDSDGQVDHFIGHQSPSPVLPVHRFRHCDDYLIGVFLVGAYQEILGDLHNLFGDTHAVHVSLEQDGRWHFEQLIRGENVQDVLQYVQFDAADLLERVSRLLGIGLGKGAIQPHEAEEMMTLYRQGLQGYTYLLGDQD